MSLSRMTEPTANFDLPFWRRFGWRMVAYFVLLAVIPPLVVLSFALIQMQAQTERQVINQLESVVELKQDQITRWLDGNGLILNSFLADDERLARLAALTTRPPLEADQTAISAELRRLAQLHTAEEGPYFHQVFVYDRSGNIIASSDDAQIGKIVINQPYFAKSLEDIYIQPPYYAVGSARLTMLITRPFRDQNDQTSGVLAGMVNLDRLGRIMLERTGLGARGETYLVSEENNYLLTPSRLPNYPLNRAYHSIGIDRGLAGEPGAGTYTNYRSPPSWVIGAYRWVPAMQAVLLAEIDEDEAMAFFGKTAQISVALTLTAALIAALTGLVVATRFSRPIGDLARAATQVAAGTLDQRVISKRRDELGLLATAFNHMTAHLQQTLAELEQRVAARTADLERANDEAQRALTELRESVRERELLSATVRELSSPVVPVQEGILVMPLIGVIDSVRATMLTETLLAAIEQHRARVVIIDVTGVPLIDSQVAQTLIRTADATRLLGVRSILVGIRPELAQTIVGLGLDLSRLIMRADLQSGVSYALQCSRQ